MNINDIDTLSNLKEYSSFIGVKNALKDNCGFRIKARSWKTLFEKLQNIKQIINNSFALSFITNNFILSKKKINTKFDIHSYADNLEQLKNDLDKFISFFTIKKFDPYEEFEKSKIADFEHSSRLEGINTKYNDKSRDAILKKYKVNI